MLKHFLSSRLSDAIRAASESLNGLQADDATMALLKLERPRQKEHGDYAVNVSPLAKLTRMAPPKIAEILAEAMHQADADNLFEITVIGGFINIKFSLAALLQPIAALAQSNAPGQNDAMADQRILLEYVSANPTGPLHIGHGRWAALGDSLVRIFRHCGATVSPEFYVNDAGVQMRNIAVSVFRRALVILNETGAITAEDAAAFNSEDIPYPGEYVIDLAKRYLEDIDATTDLLTEISSLKNQAPVTHEQLPESLLAPLRQFCREKMLAEQTELMAQMGVHFDRFYSEKDELYAQNKPQQALEKLRASGKVYEADDAVWFRTTDYGDEKDRVLQKSDGSYTYLTPDIAYHDDKFSRTGADGQLAFNRIMNIWGADHHGYIPRMKAAVQALGHPVDQFEVLLGQLVNLIIDGEKTRMGKRRKMLTLADVVEEVGVDATRLWMVWKPAETALDFDVALATSSTNDNPVFYIQYAHARCCSILRNATEAQLNAETGEMLPPKIDSTQLEAFLNGLSPQQLLPIFDGVTENAAALDSVKSLLLKLDGFDDIVADAGRIRSPHLIARYAVDLSGEFHGFYQACRVLTDNPEVTMARLVLILALKKTLAQALALLGVSAPERM